MFSLSSFDGSDGSLADSKSSCGINANSGCLKFLGTDGDISKESLDGICLQCRLVEFVLGSDLVQVSWMIGSLEVDLEYSLQSGLVSDLGHPLWVVWMALLLLIWFAPCFVSPVI